MEYFDIDKKFEDMRYKIIREVDNRLSKILSPIEINEDIYFEGKKVRNCFHSEFNQYRSELSNTISNVNTFEQKVLDSLEMVNSELVQVNKDICLIKGNIDILFNKVKSTEDKLIQIEVSSSSSIKNVNESITLLQNNSPQLYKDIQNNALMITKQSKNIEAINLELSEQIKSLEKTLSNKMKITAESINDIILNFNKEIDHFESHILNEHNSFINFSKSSNDDHINKIKSIISYLTNDIELLRNKCDYNDNSIHKLRSDVFNSIQTIEEFFLNQKIKIF